MNKIIPNAHLSNILNDFIFIGPAHNNLCMNQLNAFSVLCEQIGLPLKQNKTVLPTTNIIVHGNYVRSR